MRIFQRSERKFIHFGIGWVLVFLVHLSITSSAWGAIATDVTVYTNRSSSGSNITSPSFSTASDNELLLAFVSTDAKSSGITVTSVTGAGLTWALVRRTNVQLGTAEIWRAFAPARLSNVTVRANLSQSVAASITIVSFTGIDTSGTNGSGAIGATGSGNANPGAPTATLISTRNNSWVFGAGCDWDKAISRTVPSNQSIVNQYLATVGDTYWVQRQNTPTPTSGTTVTINDTAPATDRYNLTIVEILSAPTSGATYTVAGAITPASLGSGSTVTLSQNGTTISTAIADINGNYSFTGVANGTYSVAPSKSGINFNPTSQSVTVNAGPATVTAFAATATISGTISPANSGAGTLVTLSGPNQLTLTTTANASGSYSFTGLQTGSYTVSPSKAGYTFTPTSQGVNISSGSGTANFTATPVQTYTISGAVSPAAAGSGTLLTLSGSPGNTTTADSSGNYSFTGLGNGSYTVTPSKTGYTFNPTSQIVPINSGNATGVNFTALPSPGDWLTYGHDSQRSGNAAGESVITTSSVRNLALKWTAGLDGKVTAQPLFVSATLVGGQTRDMVIAATAANSVYALDAATGTQLWRKNFGVSSGSGVVPGGFGISASPAIDRNRGLIYTVSDDGLLRTLNLSDGTEASSAVAVVVDSINSQTPINTTTNMVWGGLNLVGGNLYVTTASDGNDTNPWWGRILRIDVSGPTPVMAGWFKVVPSIAMPNGGGGIWGYGGVSVDSLGRVFAATAADSKPWSTTVPEGYTPYAGRMVALAGDLGYSPASNPLGNPLGSYEPPHPSPCPGSPGVCDMDFGATPIIFQPSTCPATLTAAVNKDGHIYVLPANDLATSITTSLQGLALNIAFDGPGQGGLTGIPAFWPSGNMLFVTGGGPGINGISAGVAGLTVNCSNPPNYLQVAWSVSLAAANNQPPSSPTVANGVVFVGSGVNGSVHAFDAMTGTELWNSGSVISSGATFAAPMVASGTLYIATWNGFTTGDGGTIRAFTTNGGSGQPPVVTVTNPTAGSTVSGVVSIMANVVDTATITSVQFYVDATPVGAPLTAGPYTVFWDTQPFTNGQHQITASATDSLNLTGTSAPVLVTVNNTNPPNAIGIDATVFQDTGNTMTTPAFSTTTTSDLLVAFAGYDGPSNAPQTATVSGAGLSWTLVKRSNIQHGTSEIWVAKATGILTNVTVTSQPGVSGYHGSLVVVAFTNAAGPGIVGQASAPSGAPDISLSGVSAGNWVFAVGNDWDNAIARTQVSGQVLVHQRLDTATGDTYWVQSTASPSTAIALVDIHDNAPTNDQWNYSAVEIVATHQ